MTIIIPDDYIVVSREQNYTVVRGPSSHEKRFLIHGKNSRNEYVTSLTHKEFHFYEKFTFNFFSKWAFIIIGLFVATVCYEEELSEYISIAFVLSALLVLLLMSILVAPLHLYRYIRKLPPEKRDRYIALARHFTECRNTGRARVAKLILFLVQ